MFSLSGFHVFPITAITRFPHAAFGMKPKWPATSKQCLLCLFEWQGGTLKTTVIPAPAEPLGSTPCCTMPQDRGDTTQANARRALSRFRRSVPSLLDTALYEAVVGIRNNTSTITTRRSVNIHDYLAIARLVLHQQRQPADVIPARGPKHSTQFLDHFASHPWLDYYGQFTSTVTVRRCVCCSCVSVPINVVSGTGYITTPSVQ